MGIEFLRKVVRKMKKVSVIMPCLNVGKFIDQCLRSVVSQTLHDIEIIVIDAGSTDGTLEIVEHYRDQDERIQLIHADRKSYGYQVNIGISKANGQYISIVETDDFIERDMLEVLYREIAGTNAEYIKASAEPFFDDGVYYAMDEIIPYEKAKAENKSIVDPSTNPRLFVTDNFIWNGIYRADYIKQFPLNETSGAAFQEISLLFRLIQNAHMGIYLDKIVYHYRQNNEGSSFYNQKSLGYVAGEYQSLEKYAENSSSEWRKIYYWKLIWNTLNRFNYMSFCDFWQDAEASILWLKQKIYDAFERQILCSIDFPEDLWLEVSIFLRDEHMLQQYYKDRYEYHALWNEKLIARIKHKGTVIFGCGIMGKALLKRLTWWKINVTAFCDNDLKKQNSEVCGIDVLSPMRVLERYPEAFFLVANKVDGDMILEQLKSMGISADRILYYNDILLYQDAFTLRILWDRQVI